MKTRQKKVIYTKKSGAVCRCPVCRHVCRLRSDPAYWYSIGEDPVDGCRHLVTTSTPTYVNRGMATFVFNVTYKAA